MKIMEWTTEELIKFWKRFALW